MGKTQSQTTHRRTFWHLRYRRRERERETHRCSALQRSNGAEGKTTTVHGLNTLVPELKTASKKNTSKHRLTQTSVGSRMFSQTRLIKECDTLLCRQQAASAQTVCAGSNEVLVQFKKENVSYKHFHDSKGNLKLSTELGGFPRKCFPRQITRCKPGNITCKIC